jgi:membrane protein
MIELYKRLKQSEIRLVAGALAFSTVLALIPFLGLTLSVFQLIGGLEFLVPKIQGLFFRYFREALGNEVTQIIKVTLLKINPRALGTTAATFLIVTSFRLLQDMEYGINRMWKAKPTRPHFNRLGIVSILMLLIPLLLAIYAGIRSVEMLKPLFRANRDIVDGTVAIAGLFLIFKILPEARVNTKKAFIGAFASGVGLIILEKTFAFFTKSFIGINKIYGSIATIPLFLIYILIVWYIILIGAAYVAYLHRGYDLPIHKS